MLPIFDLELCHLRWHKKYIAEFIHNKNNFQNTNSHINMIQTKKSENITTFSKRMKVANVYTNKLSSFAAEYCGEYFDNCINFFKISENIIKNHNLEALKKFIGLIF